ncbi:MAG: serine/threonine protein phosphatase [Deltaproteobacteria bacterium]|nr:serine/threonine protein phosphatase [Deltaproteobacteria bacterium]
MRTIVVGDVHGCRVELEALLDRLAFACGDRLVFVGDLIARGPDSLGVLDLVRRTGAVVVRGNHEQKLLEWRAARNAWLHRSAAAKPPMGRIHRDLARALRPIDWSVLETTPLFADFPDHGMRVVHAGVRPGTRFEDQAPETLTRIRTVPSPAAGRRKGEQVLWGSIYEGPPQMVFGHNAAPGLQLHPWATGLDTGCVYGGRLTALVLQHGQRIPRSVAARRDLLVSEPARRMWFTPASHHPPVA